MLNCTGLAPLSRLTFASTCLGLKVHGLGFRAHGLGFKVQGLGFRVAAFSKGLLVLFVLGTMTSWMHRGSLNFEAVPLRSLDVLAHVDTWRVVEMVVFLWAS